MTYLYRTKRDVNSTGKVSGDAFDAISDNSYITPSELGTYNSEVITFTPSSGKELIYNYVLAPDSTYSLGFTVISGYLNRDYNITISNVVATAEAVYAIKQDGATLYSSSTKTGVQLTVPRSSDSTKMLVGDDLLGWYGSTGTYGTSSYQGGPVYGALSTIKISSDDSSMLLVGFSAYSYITGNKSQITITDSSKSFNGAISLRVCSIAQCSNYTFSKLAAVVCVYGSAPDNTYTTETFVKYLTNQTFFIYQPFTNNITPTNIINNYSDTLSFSAVNSIPTVQTYWCASGATFTSGKKYDFSSYKFIYVSKASTSQSDYGYVLVLYKVAS